MIESILRVVDLNPSLAIFPLQLAQGFTVDGVAAHLHSRIEILVGIEPKTGDARKNVFDVQYLPPETLGGWTYTGAIYRLEVAPSWLVRKPPPDANVNENNVGDNGGDFEEGDDDLQDIAVEDHSDPPVHPRDRFRQHIWHLALVGISASPGQLYGRMVIHSTQDIIAGRLREYVTAGRFGQVMSGDACAIPFDDRVLQAHCLNGEARQAALWGLHRSVKSKPDRKSLMGLDLKEAMDPFADQTYRLTSAVSIDSTRKPTFLGLSLKRQRVWSQKGNKLEEFSTILNGLFKDLEAVDFTAPGEPRGLNQDGYRDLAKTLDPNEILDAKDAFEVAFRPLTDLDPMLIATPDGERTDKEIAWFAEGQVKLGTATPGTSRFTVEVSRSGQHLATLEVTPVPDVEGVSLTIASTLHVPGTHPDLELFETLIEGDGLSRRLAVWYDSGHALVEGQVSFLEYRDVRFDAWKWIPMVVMGQAVEVTEEKPTKPSHRDPNKRVADLDAIGQQRSLFDFSLLELPKHFPDRLNGGPLWSICDDGSGEIADFILYAPFDRRLWLVHAKGADSDAVGREISVSAYEQVVSQARKNLRFFDGPKLAMELRSRGVNKPRIWRDGTPMVGPDHARARDEICMNLAATHFFEDRQMVVLQPHVSKASWERARGRLSANDQNHTSVKRYRLLSALLADLQITAQKFDVGFMAIGPEQ